MKIVEELGAFKVVEYLKDLSVDHLTAQAAYYASEMNVRRRQLVCDVSLSDITVQSGAMQWMVGDVSATTGLKGVGDFIGKAFRGKVTNESAIKPEYTGTGKLVLEPTYKHILLIDVDDWNGSIVIEDGLFLACDSELNHKAVMKSNLSSIAMGGEGLFNLGLSGGGIVALESYVPREELIEIELENDELKIDGNMAIAWSGSLEFTVDTIGQDTPGFSRIRRRFGKRLSRNRQSFDGARSSIKESRLRIQQYLSSFKKGSEQSVFDTLCSDPFSYLPGLIPREMRP